MTSDIISISVGETWRHAGMVLRASGGPITTGTVNYYLKCLTGTNAGKWWKNSDQTWAAVETANAMTHQGDGGWTVELASSPFEADEIYYEYAKEATDLHVSGEGRLLRGQAAITAQIGMASADMDDQLAVILAAAQATLTGGGAYSGVLTIDDGTDPIQGVECFAYNSTGTMVARGTTDANGRVANWALNGEEYSISARKAYYSSESSALTPTGDGWTRTISLEAVSIVGPSVPNTATGIIELLDEYNEPEPGAEVSVRFVDGPGFDGYSYDTTVWTEVADESGIAQFVGLAIGATYKIWRGDATDSEVEFVVPDQSTFYIEEVSGQL